MRSIPLFVLLLLSVSGCASQPPRGVEAITGFDLNRYLGRWFEIARLNHSFERGLNDVTAEYEVIDSETIRVKNRGYDEDTNAWQDIEGRAKFAGNTDTGSLKVAFFGPFFAGYHIIALDKEDYQYAMVCGPTRKYLWILCRTPEIDEAIYRQLLDQAASLGFDTDALIEVTHTRATP